MTNFNKKESVCSDGQDEEQDAFNPEDVSHRPRVEAMTVETYLGKLEKGKIIIQPAWQRHNVWKDKQKREFIESVLSNALEVPPIYVVERTIDGKQKLAIIDGGQRSKALLDFKQNTITLKNLNIYSTLNGKSFKTLADVGEEWIDRFNSHQFQLVTYPLVTKDKVIIEVFKRLNTGGTKLNATEIRNGLYMGPLMDFVREMCKYPPLKDLTGEINNKRMEDVNLVLQLLCLIDYYDRVDPRSGGGAPKGIYSLGDLIERFCKEKINIDEGERKRLGGLFKKCVRTSHSLFGPSPFILSKKKKGGIHYGMTRVIVPSCLGYCSTDVPYYRDCAKECLKEIRETEIWKNGLASNAMVPILSRGSEWKELIESRVTPIKLDDKRCFDRSDISSLFDNGSYPICSVCRKEIYSEVDAEWDHAIPYSKGGPTNDDNKRISHYLCNRVKGNRDLFTDVN